jgi:hypothetical protein
MPQQLFVGGLPLCFFSRNKETVMPQQLFIPHLGAQIILDQDWCFKLYFERRNATLLAGMVGQKKINVPYSVLYNAFWSGTGLESNELTTKLGEAGIRILTNDAEEGEKADMDRTHKVLADRNDPFVYCTLPTETYLTFDRIYIRRGVSGFDSVTFRTNKNCPEPNFRGRRFWAKLDDINNIVCNVIG